MHGSRKCRAGRPPAELDVIAGMVGATHRHSPIAKNVAVYQALLPIFLALPKQLEAQYRQIAEFQQQSAEMAAVNPSADQAR